MKARPLVADARRGGHRDAVAGGKRAEARVDRNGRVAAHRRVGVGKGENDRTGAAPPLAAHALGVGVTVGPQPPVEAHGRIDRINRVAPAVDGKRHRGLGRVVQRRQRRRGLLGRRPGRDLLIAARRRGGRRSVKERADTADARVGPRRCLRVVINEEGAPVVGGPRFPAAREICVLVLFGEGRK